MPRSASTTNRTEIIYQMLKNSRLKSIALIYRWDTVLQSWVRLEDFIEGQGVDFTENKKRYKWANFGLTPLPSTIAFNVLNRNGEYSEGSGTTKEGKIDLDTKIKLKAGYLLPEAAAATDITLPLADSDAFFFHTQVSGSNVILDSSTPTTTDIYFSDLFSTYYDTVPYGSAYYTAAGYYLKTYDTGYPGYSIINSFTISCNSDKGRIFYRGFNDQTSAEGVDASTDNWIEVGATANGDFTASIAVTNRFLQIAIVIDGVTWSDDFTITGISINKADYGELIFTDVYYLDSPEFTEPSISKFPEIACAGRDILKKMIETDINLENINGQPIDDVIKNQADKLGIQYTTDSIADLSAFSNRTLTSGLGGTKKGFKVYEYIMQLLQQSGKTNYEMYTLYDSTIDDKVLYVQPTPSKFAADYVLSYKHFLSIKSFKKNFDKQAQRFTVLSDEATSNPEVTLNTTTHNTSGTKTQSWSGNAQFKRYTVVVNSGDAVVTLNEDRVNNTSIKFDITGSSIDVTITIYGCKWSTVPDYEGEDINHNNMVNISGKSVKISNPLVISDAECKAVSEGLMIKYGDPIRESNGLTYPYLNLISEINDVLGLWSKNLFLDDLYFNVKINHHWDNKKGNSNFNLDDTGKDLSDLGDVIYDRNEPSILPGTESNPPVNYDYGYHYEMRLGAQGTPSEIDTSLYRKDIAFS